MALVAGIVLQRLWPGDFDYGLRHGGPALATWIALVGGLRRARRSGSCSPARRCASSTGSVPPRRAASSLPVFVHGVWHWSPRVPTDPHALSPRLVHRLRTVVPKGAVVIAPVETSYRVAADAPVYVVAAPVAHVANTKANDPYARARPSSTGSLTNDPRGRRAATGRPGRSAAAVSIVCRGEGAPRHDVLPACRAAAACSGR